MTPSWKNTIVQGRPNRSLGRKECFGYWITEASYDLNLVIQELGPRGRNPLAAHVLAINVLSSEFSHMSIEDAVQELT